MATKSVYLYQVKMGHGDKDEEVAFCYARNAGCAVSGYKEIFKEKKYDSFKAKMFGEADIRIHDKPFEIMTKDEVDYVMKYGLGSADAYAQQKNPQPPAGGTFVPVKGEIV